MNKYPKMNEHYSVCHFGNSDTYYVVKRVRLADGTFENKNVYMCHNAQEANGICECYNLRAYNKALKQTERASV